MKIHTIILLIIFLNPASGFCEIYKTVTADGKVIFSDKQSDDAETVELNQANVTSIAVNTDWDSLMEKSAIMMLKFEKITLNTAIDLIAKHAYEKDGVVIAHNDLLGNNKTGWQRIAVDYGWQPWARVIDDLAKKHNLKIQYDNNVVRITPGK